MYAFVRPGTANERGFLWVIGVRFRDCAGGDEGSEEVSFDGFRCGITIAVFSFRFKAAQIHIPQLHALVSGTGVAYHDGNFVLRPPLLVLDVLAGER